MASTEGFEAFYAGTVARLIGQLLPVTGDLHEAEEVVQEAFARASVRWSQLRDYDVPEAWVRRVALNLATDRSRDLRRQARALLRLGPPPQVPAASAEAVALLEALRTLSMRQRQAIVLYHLVDLPHRGGRPHARDRPGSGQEPARPRPPRPGQPAQRRRGGAQLTMIHLRDHLQELAEAGARQGRTAGSMAAIRRGRQRRRRLASGTAALLAAVLVAGAVGADHLSRGGRRDAPASPPTTARFPAKLATYAATVAFGSAEEGLLGMLTDRSDGLGACKGGRPEDVRIVAVGPLPHRQGVWMIAARPPLPTERRLCWMFGFGNRRSRSSPVAYVGEPPPLTMLHANASGDPSKLVVDGYVTKQAARVRLILAGGKPPLDVEPLQSGSDFPVNFFVAVVPWQGSERLPVERLVALDGSGRAITSCWLRDGHPSCGGQGRGP